MKRLELKYLFKTLHRVYIHYCSPSISYIVILFSDSSYKAGTLIDNSLLYSDNYRYAYNKRNYKFQFILQETEWKSGIWKNIDATNIDFLSNIESCASRFNIQDNGSVVDELNQVFFEIKSLEILENILMFCSTYRNRCILESNLNSKKIVVNPSVFGKAVVYKNFMLNSPLSI